MALFALLGFAFVPLGKKTALEHSLAIFSTPAAIGAFRELGQTVVRLRDRLIASVVPPTVLEAPTTEEGAAPAEGAAEPEVIAKGKEDKDKDEEKSE